MMVLQHSSVRKVLGWHAITIMSYNAKLGIFLLNYTAIPSFMSCFTTFYHLDPYFIFSKPFVKNNKEKVWPRIAQEWLQ